jgi:hypothetical protein
VSGNRCCKHAGRSRSFATETNSAAADGRSHSSMWEDIHEANQEYSSQSLNVKCSESHGSEVDCQRCHFQEIFSQMMVTDALLTNKAARQPSGGQNVCAA